MRNKILTYTIILAIILVIVIFLLFYQKIGLGRESDNININQNILSSQEVSLEPGSPGDTIYSLEKSYLEGEVEDYIDKTYFSESLIEKIDSGKYSALGSTIEVYKEQFREQASWILDMMEGLELVGIEILSDVNLEDDLIKLEYTLIYQTTEGEYLYRNDSTFFRLVDEEWFIDVEQELIHAGYIPGPRKDPPVIPEGLKDCTPQGTEVITDESALCFYNATESCTPAFIRLSESLGSASIEITKWITNNCELHEYTDSIGPISSGQFYTICPYQEMGTEYVTGFENPYEKCWSPEGWIGMKEVMDEAIEDAYFISQLDRMNYERMKKEGKVGWTKKYYPSNHSCDYYPNERGIGQLKIRNDEPRIINNQADLCYLDGDIVGECSGEGCTKRIHRCVDMDGDGKNESYEYMNQECLSCNNGDCVTETETT